MSSSMEFPSSLLILFLFLTCFTTPLISTTTTTTTPPHHHPTFLKHTHKLHQNESEPPPPPQYFFEVTQPLPTDTLIPSCTLPILRHNFSNTYGQPPVNRSYSPPVNCTWSLAVLEFSASIYGEQYDRVAAVWLDGAELLRTTTAEPNENGVFWKVHKDVTKYASLLVEENSTLSVMLENLVNDVFTGVYQVNVTFLYYDLTAVIVPSSKLSRKLLDQNDNLIALDLANDNKLSSSGFYDVPADLILPISGFGDGGFWYRIESQLGSPSTLFQIPRNTYKAVLEIYLSYHGDDEFWYKNTKKGAYREVIVTIDGEFVGSVVPFPVIFTGGINPLFWEPVVGIGAFDLPTYDIDLTPFLGLLLDGKAHSLGLSVADGISFWLVDANLHLWLDRFVDEVQAGYIATKLPSFEIEREQETKGLEGEYEVEMERKREFSGWVNSSAGNFTSYVKHELEFESKIKITQNGNHEKIEQEVKEKYEVEVKSDTGVKISETKIEKEYPLKITTSTVLGIDGTYNMTTTLDNSYEEKGSTATGSSKLRNRQLANGWMVVNGSEVVSGETTTNQNYSYKAGTVCYSRVVAAANGTLVSDTASLMC